MSLKSISPRQGELFKGLYNLPGEKILNQILELNNPVETVRAMSSEDFFWIIKKIGEDNSLQLLELASTEQWQYILDLEIWKGDRLDTSQFSMWLKLLQEADCERLVEWFFSEAESLAHLHFFKSLEVVVVNDKDEVYDLPEGFFSLDGVLYIKVYDQDEKEYLEDIIRTMAHKDLTRFQALFLGLGGVLQAENEEELFRLRNRRLSEHGFLPLEEALSVYAPLNPKDVMGDKIKALPEPSFDAEYADIVPVSPLYHTGPENLLSKVTENINDPLLMDRLRLEFAGLCNQIISADGVVPSEIDVLIRTCRKAGRYLNLGLERLCGNDLSSLEQTLKRESLLTIFRVGFGLILKIKWEADRWLKEAWFFHQELPLSFWGEIWGGLLTGLLAKTPQFYTGIKEDEAHRDFEWLSELGESMVILRHIMVVDSLIENLTAKYKIEKLENLSTDMTFHPIIFNLWAGEILGLEIGFSEISLKNMRRFFEKIRAGSKKRPYRVSRFKDNFIDYFMGHAVDANPEAAAILREALSFIWAEFCEEYEMVSLSDLDARFSRFLRIKN